MSIGWVNNLSTIEDSLKVGNAIPPFTADEGAFIAKVLGGADGKIFAELMHKANAAGVCAGIDEERRNNAMR